MSMSPISQAISASLKERVNTTKFQVRSRSLEDQLAGKDALAGMTAMELARRLILAARGSDSGLTPELLAQIPADVQAEALAIVAQHDAGNAEQAADLAARYGAPPVSRTPSWLLPAGIGMVVIGGLVWWFKFRKAGASS